MIPNLQPPEDAEKEHLDLPSPGDPEKDVDADMLSSTIMGSEHPGKSLDHDFMRSTRLVPCADSASDSNDEKRSGNQADARRPGLSRSLLSQHDVLYSKPTPLEWIVVRIEVTDTGCGIRPKDMVQTKLFCE